MVPAQPRRAAVRLDSGLAGSAGFRHFSKISREALLFRGAGGIREPQQIRWVNRNAQFATVRKPDGFATDFLDADSPAENAPGRAGAQGQNSARANNRALCIQPPPANVYFAR